MRIAGRAALCALLCLGLASCATGGGRHGFGRGPGGSQRGSANDVGIGPKADPVALFIAGLDANLDGVVTSDELSAALPKLWASADPSGAASISILELNDWRKHWFGSDDGWPGQFHFDTDGDGQITHKEFDAGLKAVFDNFDARKDGRITRDELLGPGGRGAQSATHKSDNDDENQGEGRHRRRGPGGSDEAWPTRH